jgi:hypothetical protein
VDTGIVITAHGRPGLPGETDSHWTNCLSESQSSGAETPQKHIRAKESDVLGIKEIQKIEWLRSLELDTTTERMNWSKHDGQITGKEKGPEQACQVIQHAKCFGKFILPMKQVREPDLEEPALTAEIGRREMLNHVYITIDKQSRTQCEPRSGHHLSECLNKK